MKLPNYRSSLLDKQIVAGSWNDIYHKVCNFVTSRKFKIGAAVSAASLVGLVALAHTDLPKQASDYWKAPVPLSLGYAEPQPYVVRPEDTLEKLSGGNPLAKEYIMRANGVKDPKRDLKAGDIIAVPGTDNDKLIRELLSKLQIQK